MTDKKIASIIQQRFVNLQGQFSEVFDNSEMYNQMYRCYMDNTDTYLWDYNLVEPVVFYLIRSLMARMNTDNMRVRLDARTSDAEQKRKVNQRIIDWEMGEMKKTLIFYNFIFRGLISGRAYLKTGWLYNKALQVKGDNGDKTMRSIINRAYAQNVRFPDILIPNQNIPDLDEQPYVLEHMMVRYGDLVKDNEASTGKDIWNPDALRKIEKKSLFENKMDYGIDLPDDDEGKEDWITNSRYVSVIRMQTKDNEVYHCLEKDDSIILDVDHNNPYWHNHQPYITWTPFPEDDEYASMGAVQPVSDLVIALSSILNQYLTNARKSGNPMWLAGAAAAQTPDWMFVNRPDGIIRVAGDVNQVQQVRPMDTSDTMLRMRQEVMTSFERTSAMSSMFSTGVASGSSPQLNKTATGARVIDSNIETNLQMLVSLFGAMALSKLGEHFLELNAQYISEEQEIKIVGKDGDPEFVKIEPSEVTANFDVIANADTMAKTSPAVRQAQLLNLKATIDQEKVVKMDKKPIWKAIFNAFPEMDGVTDDVIVDPEQQAKEAIQLLLSGIEPKIAIDMDHKAIVQLIQVFLLSNPNLPDEQLVMFTKYLDDLRKYIQAKQVIVTLNQPLAPTDPNAMAMSMGATPPQMNGGQMLPTEEQNLMKSLNSQIQMGTNPTEGLPNKLPEQAIQ